MSRAGSVVVVLALLVACERPRPANRELAGQRAVRELTGTLSYPGSAIMSVSLGEATVEVAVSSPDSVQEVARWLLRVLPRNQWDVKRTINDRSGTVTIEAEREQRPLWLMLRPSSGEPGTTYTMVGAIPKDSTP